MVLALGALALPASSFQQVTGVTYTNCADAQGEENAPEGLLNAVCTAISEMQQPPMSYQEALADYYDCGLTFEMVGENTAKVTYAVGSQMSPVSRKISHRRTR